MRVLGDLEGGQVGVPSLLIRNGLVVTMDGDRIVEVGPQSECRHERAGR